MILIASLLGMDNSGMSGLDYLKHVRTLRCQVCPEPAEPHHLKPIGMGNLRFDETPRHYTALNLCRVHHTEIEVIGMKKFEDRHGINCWREAFRNYLIWATGGDFNR